MVIVAITGTPGTGKDTISGIVAKRLGWNLVDLNKLAKQKGLIKGFDKKRNCEIVDISGLKKEIKKIRGNAIIQSHYSHELNSDLVIVLRTEPKELKKRLEKRGWLKEKIEENLEAEIMEVCNSEALQKTKDVFEVSTSGRSPEKSAEEAVNIIFREAFEPERNLRIPEVLVGNFKRPYGMVFGSERDFLKSKVAAESSGLLISVGDLSGYMLMEAGFNPDIVVVDGKVKREKFRGKITFGNKKFKVINKPGMITRGLWNTIKKAIAKYEDGGIKIFVVGEEDLAVLPAVIMAPLGSVVLYGQPEMLFNGENIREGLVAVEINMEKKKDALNLLKKIIKSQ